MYNLVMHPVFSKKYRPTINGCRPIPNVVKMWELLDFRREAQKEGFEIIHHNSLAEGLSGVLAHKRTLDAGRNTGAKRLEAYYLCYPVFGKVLESDEKTVGGPEWKAEMELHQDHGDNFYIYRAAESLESVFICYCQAHEGKSITRRASARELANMEKQVSNMVERMWSEIELEGQ